MTHCKKCGAEITDKNKLSSQQIVLANRCDIINVNVDNICNECFLQEMNLKEDDFDYLIKKYLSRREECINIMKDRANGKVIQLKDLKDYPTFDINKPILLQTAPFPISYSDNLYFNDYSSMIRLFSTYYLNSIRLLEKRYLILASSIL